MKEIKKIGDVKCDKEECQHNAVTEIKSSDGIPLRLCVKHEESLAEEIRQNVEEKYEGLTPEEIAEEIKGDLESIL